MIDLSGQTALVTGGSRGIGAACALRLAQAGADVALTYLNAPIEAQSTGAQIMALGRRVLLLKADLSEEEDAALVVDAIGEQWGGLDIIVSNAAGGGFRPLGAVTPENFSYAMNLNARAFMLLMQSATAMLVAREGRASRARAITLSSWGAERALPMYGGIGATKAALEALTRHFALELGPRGVNVNCVRAGVVDTGALRELPGVEVVLEERRRRSMVEGRNVTPEDVANTVLFLASPLADMVQGQVLVVDGGTSLHP
jgi:enoyl-[acyl-carrier protein] reductase III